jgi:hypothetical protein
VTIDAAGFNASVISTSATDLCTINAGSTDRVVLRGISFHGAGTGNNAINVTQVGSLYIEHCSISEFTSSAVFMPNGGNLFVTGTDVRKCFSGLVAGTSSTTALNLVAHDSRFTECSNSCVQLATGFGTGLGSGAAIGTLINCTAALGGVGFWADAGSFNGRVDMTLVNCRAMGNTNSGVFAGSGAGTPSTIRMANCVLTQNNFGITTVNGSVIGTNTGTNLISGNNADVFPGSSVTLH